LFSSATEIAIRHGLQFGAEPMDRHLVYHPMIDKNLKKASALPDRSGRIQE
jgi:hypothetical protein